MPMTMKYKQMNNRNLVAALSKLANHQGFRGQFAYTVSKLIRKWDEESKIAQELFMKLIKQYAKKDEKGELAKSENGPLPFVIEDEKKADWDKATEAFDETEFTIEVHKLRVSQIEDVGFSPVHLIALEPMLTEMEAVDTAEPVKTAG